MNDITPPVQLAHTLTRDLNDELIKREGVNAIFRGPDDTITKTVRGPAWVLINRD
ncbi:BC1881 family protein [Roseobacter sp. HKCCA0434]|uniref:BC1881 family protein n=1 Tax=Roseobacter sp. HKCCA0434 TaxID=3079297 RepID=UPI003966BC1A